MPSTRDIRRRIKSVKNTSQITRAMQMVAASKMRRAQQKAMAGRPYSELMNRVLVSLKERTEVEQHPLLEVRDPVAKELVIMVSTDKGLCGGLNTNLAREAGKLQGDHIRFLTSGSKGRQYLVRTKREIAADFPLKDDPAFLESKQISKFAMDQFLSGDADKVSVLYTHFENTLTQTPVLRTILPISPFDLPGAEEDEAAREADVAPGMLFEPSAQEVLEAILPYYVHFQIYQMILDARASEHSARMVAMKNATDNAKQLVKDLTLEYNKLRQAGITQEILEIATAQVALEG